MKLSWLWARLDGLRCILRGHTVRWRAGADDICTGDIICDTCNRVIWCRWYDPWRGNQT
jgi:hypothetical protein